jgi:hypothetical protein
MLGGCTSHVSAADGQLESGLRGLRPGFKLRWLWGSGGGPIALEKQAPPYRARGHVPQTAKPAGTFKRGDGSALVNCPPRPKKHTRQLRRGTRVLRSISGGPRLRHDPDAKSGTNKAAKRN